MLISFVLVQCGDEYENWSRYRLYYNTPETDRDYLLYWETIMEKIKVCMLPQSANLI